MLNLSAEASAALEDRLRSENIAWITTVTPGEQPQSSPVWFVWDDGEFLVYAQPRSAKVRNIRTHPQVSLHLNSDDHGGRVVTFEGSARIGEEQPPVHEVAAYHAKYRAKYRDAIADLGWTPEHMAADYSTALHITPTRVRVY